MDAYSQKHHYQVAAIAFYNLENLYDTINDPATFDDEFTPNGANHYTQAIYNKKLHKLATVIRQLGTELTPDGPAILGIAEAENERVLQDLAAQPEIESRHYSIVHFEGADTRGIDCAVLYNPKYFRLLSARSIYVDLQMAGDEGKTRDILYICGLLAGDTTHVLVNHWPSRRGNEAASVSKRAIAATVARGITDSLMKIDSMARVIVMGDLNDDPADISLTQTMKASGDQSEVKNGALFNPFMKIYKQGVGSLAYHDSWNLFDQILVSETYLNECGDGWKYYKSEVFNRDFLKNKFSSYKGYPHRNYDGTVWLDGYSDHFPTLIYLVRKKE